MGCSYLSLHKIPAAGANVLISYLFCWGLFLNLSEIRTWISNYIHWICYPRPFWPTGIVIACVCQLLLVQMITHHTFQLESPDLDEKMQNILLKVPIVLGADWAWPSMSNLTSFKNSVHLHRFCIFEIFVRRAKTGFVELFHITHGAAHILIPIYTRRQGRAMDRETV